MHRTLITVLPPLKAWDEGKVLKYVKEILEISAALKSAINVPEVLEFGRKGGRPTPFRPKMDLLEFSHILKGEGGRILLDRYVPLMEKEEYIKFLKKAKSVVDGFVAVGKPTSDIQYSGYDVLEGINLAKKLFKSVGAITIFSRKNEIDRVCEKIKAGAEFFISQITFNPDDVEDFVKRLKDRCAEESLPFPKLYVSVTPALTSEDIELLRWMEVDVPPSPPPLSELIRRMRDIEGVYGVNYEQLRYSNLNYLSLLAHS